MIEICRRLERDRETRDRRAVATAARLRLYRPSEYAAQLTAASSPPSRPCTARLANAGIGGSGLRRGACRSDDAFVGDADAHGRAGDECQPVGVTSRQLHPDLAFVLGDVDADLEAEPHNARDVAEHRVGR